MQLPLALLAASALPLSALALPNPLLKSRTDCGNSRKFYDATPEKWEAANTDEWLNNWWTKHQSEVESMGFAKAFTRAALDTDSLTCLLSGQDKNCVGEDACSNRKFASLSPEDMEPAYYVLSSLKGLHGYIKGYQETLETSAVVESFEQNYLTQLFFIDQNEIDPTGIKELINWLVVVLTLGSSGLGVALKAGEKTSGFIGAGNTMLGGAQTEAFLRLQVKAPDVFGATANSGHAMAKALKETFTSLFGLNDKLMNGEEIKEGDHNSGDLRQFLKGGRWVNAREMSKVNGLDKMTGALQSIQINALWSQQPVFIMGGGPCDNFELGQSPRGQPGDVGWCDTRLDQAWYLYSFRSEGTKTWVDRPPGSDRLGGNSLYEQLNEGPNAVSEFPEIEVADVIRSSIKSFWAAGDSNNYDSAMFQKRMADIMADGNVPLVEESSLEGLWTIPVCDVSANIGSNTPWKQGLLVPYESNPTWCGNFCGNSEEKTQEFLKKAHLDDTIRYKYGSKCDLTTLDQGEH